MRSNDYTRVRKFWASKIFFVWVQMTSHVVETYRLSIFSVHLICLRMYRCYSSNSIILYSRILSYQFVNVGCCRHGSHGVERTIFGPTARWQRAPARLAGRWLLFVVHVDALYGQENQTDCCLSRMVAVDECRQLVPIWLQKRSSLTIHF